MADKPASRYIAKALPRGGMFVGQFAAPGLIPEYVVDRDGQVMRFRKQEDAELAAAQAMIRVLNSRNSRASMVGGYTRMTPAEFASALAESDITPSAFSLIYGVKPDRVLGWLDGVQDIPHAVRVLVELLRYEDIYKEAKAITDKHMQARERPTTEGGDHGRQG